MSASPDRLVIVHVFAPGVVGGLESVVRGLAVGHRRMGHEVHVIGVVELTPTEHPYLRSLTEAGIIVHALHLPNRAYFRERQLVRAILREAHPDVVHTHGSRPDVLDAPVARSLGIPTVTTLHGSSLLGGKTVLHEWLQIAMLPRFEGVIAVSRMLETELRTKVPPERVHYIPNGLVPPADSLTRKEARRELGLADDTQVVGWVARLIPVKACDVFLKAFAELRDHSATAIVVGDGPEREMLNALHSELQLGGRLRFFGSHREAGRLFSAFDVFVLSSRSEGTPITLLEAVAAGVPVVSTAVGGVPDVIGSGEGLLVPSEDPIALGAAIRTSLEDPLAAQARAVAATRKLVTQFSAERWLATHESLYRELRNRR